MTNTTPLSAGISSLALVDGDMTVRQLAVLLTCYAHEERQTVRGLAEALHTEKSAITRAVDRFERAGLIERQRDKEDARSVQLLTTAKGRTLMDKMQALQVAA